MDTNLKDRLIQERFPTIMVPRYEELSPCPLHQTRLLMAHRGLYIDTAQPFGRFRRCLWIADRELPYGEVEEIDEFAGILVDPAGDSDLRESILPRGGNVMRTITGNGPAGSSGQRKRGTPTCRSISRRLRQAC